MLRRIVGADRLLFAVTLLAGFGLVAYFFGYLSAMEPPRDRFGYVLGRDFVNAWAGGRAVLAGKVHTLFEVHQHNHILRSLLGDMPPHNWSYPPVLLLFLWPLGFLPYMPALVLWSLAGFAAYLGAAATFNRSWRFLAFVAVAPAIAVNLFSGQNGFFSAALLILFFRFWDERPVLAGVLLGLMLIKPHLVLLFPLALVLSGRWRVFASAAVTVVMLVAVTALVFGWDVWSEYFRLVMPVQRGVMDTGTGFLDMMPTGFMQARLMGAPLSLAWKIQYPFTVLGVGAVLWCFARRRDPLLSVGVLIAAGFVATPYIFNYDMVVFGWLAAMLWPRFTRWGEKLLLLIVWSLPVTMMLLGGWGLPLAAPVMALFLIMLIKKLRDGEPAAQLQISQ